MGSPFPDDALAAQASVVEEHGRWAVYLEVALRTGMPDEPFRIVSRRIADYPTRHAADVASRWMARGANRELKSPPTGF